MKRRRIKAIWTGASFVPEARDMHYCQFMFGAGEVLVLDPEQERDMNSHRHYFAQLHEAWKNLPEELEKTFPTEDIFRKKLLIKAGFFFMEETVCDSLRQAAITVAFAAPLDPSVIIISSGNVVRKYTAMSQSIAAMGREEFQKSKWAVLDLAASLIHVTPKQLEQHAQRSDVE
jgi:hypothetical protein